ncbi:hypothetical protein ACSBR1_019179 [Camellia fascicularis]
MINKLTYWNTDTPLWRNGPPDKPVLCNACGSRWRIWGTLDNYIPKLANKGTQICQQGKLPLPIEVHDRRKPIYGAKIAIHSTGLEDDTNNGPGSGSGSGSARSSSDNCIQLEGTNGKEASGLVQPSFWNSRIPRRKRSVLNQRVLSPVERLHKQLYHTLQEPEFSNLASEQEDVLIFQNSQNSSAEIGLGCVLLKSTVASKEEDKESHSFMMQP